jgi:hypothetical protein
MQSTEFSLSERGELRITLTAQGRVDLERLLTQHPDWDDAEVFIELIDHQLAHGWYVIPPGQLRMQTQSLILTATAMYDEFGNIIDVGDTYWYPGYPAEGYTAALFNQGYIIFERGNYSGHIL